MHRHVHPGNPTQPNPNPNPSPSPSPSPNPSPSPTLALTFAGTCAIVPSLNAAGFCEIGSVPASLPDASAFAAGGALHPT